MEKMLDPFFQSLYNQVYTLPTTRKEGVEMPFLFFSSPFLSSITNTCSKGRAIKRARRVTGRVECLEEVTDSHLGSEECDGLQERNSGLLVTLLSSVFMVRPNC